LYELISDLRPYFFSLREIESNVSLDLKIPTTWKLEHIEYVIAQYKSMKYKVQDKSDKYVLVSLITVANQDGYETARACAVEIITHNKELEEKERLFKEKQKQLEAEFQLKIRELQEMFKNEPLTKLKEINLNNNGREEAGQENHSGDGVVGQGDEEGSE
jgi:hypothetical protein